MTANGAVVLAELRQARRRQRVAQIHWVDALYQVYITALMVIAAVVLGSGVVGDARVGGRALDDVVARGPAVAGLAAALSVAVGLRSGGRGGPLALEAADVRHVLLSPVDRNAALRSPALHQLRFLAFAGAGVGAVAGQLVLRRMPGNPAAWLACGAAYGLLVVALGYGAALAVSGRRLPAWPGTVAGGALVAWSVADAIGRGPTAPATFAGRLALWPLRFDAPALVPVAVALAVLAIGFAGLAGASLEAAERRTSLVGQLKFAVTLQDLRTVLVLRRQLAMELPRARPWVRGSRRPARYPVWRRGWRGVLRWPAARLARIVVLSVVAGLALRGVWSGTTPLVLLAGVATWIVALDAVEPMAQEVDHPGRREAYPIDSGELLLRHLPVSIAVMLVAAGCSAAISTVPGSGSLPAAVAVVCAVTMALTATAGAAASVLMGAPGPIDSISIATPEFAGMRTVLRTAWPLALAVAGTVPVLVARTALDERPATTSAASLATAGMFPVLLLCGLVAGWIRFREPLQIWLREAMAAASPTAQAERAAAERARAEAETGDDVDEAEPEPDHEPEADRSRPTGRSRRG